MNILLYIYMYIHCTYYDYKKPLSKHVRVDVLGFDMDWFFIFEGDGGDGGDGDGGDGLGDGMHLMRVGNFIR